MYTVVYRINFFFVFVKLYQIGMSTVVDFMRLAVGTLQGMFDREISTVVDSIEGLNLKLRVYQIRKYLLL